MRFYVVSKSPQKTLINERAENKVILQQTDLVDITFTKWSNTNKSLSRAISFNAITTWHRFCGILAKNT